jgi:hypothetical protein
MGAHGFAWATAGVYRRMSAHRTEDRRHWSLVASVDSLDEEVGSQKQASIEEPPNAEVELKVRVRG